MWDGLCSQSYQVMCTVLINQSRRLMKIPVLQNGRCCLVHSRLNYYDSNEINPMAYFTTG